MKATGIVRRIDDLGRVVIPKEIRRTMNIREGDPLEIFLEDGSVVFRKYTFDPLEDGLNTAMENALENRSEIPERVITAIKNAAAEYAKFKFENDYQFGG